MIESRELILHLWLRGNTLTIFPQPSGFAVGGVAPVEIDFKLDDLPSIQSPEEYGAKLGEKVLQPSVYRVYEHGVTNLPPDHVLRLRIGLDITDPRLAAVRWELMHDPVAKRAIGRHARVLVSRSVGSTPVGGFEPRPTTSKPRVLVVVANPRQEGPASAAYPPIRDPGRYLTAAVREGWETVALGFERPATLENIHREAERSCDLLYIVCHGVIDENGGAHLHLENDARAPSPVVVEEFVDRICNVPSPPRLVFLGSCYSAHDADGQESVALLNAVGMQLSRRGIQAVVGMQGQVGMDFLARFAEDFFCNLGESGAPDKALAAARRLSLSENDWWRPVLYMTNPDLVWPAVVRPSQPGEVDKLVSSIRSGSCLPILGPELSAAVILSSTKLASDIAAELEIPFPGKRMVADLGVVARYMKTRLGLEDGWKDVGRRVKLDLIQRRKLSRDTLAGLSDGDVVARAGAARRREGDADAYRILASLKDVSIYITTEPWGLLEDALAATERLPVVEVCRWNQALRSEPSQWESEPGYVPSPERPLVYHLFGVWDKPRSLVLSDDDQLDFVTSLASGEAKIPSLVLQALAQRDHLYLGFHVERREFRLLQQALRALLPPVGKTGRTGKTIVQVDPAACGQAAPDAAQRYLIDYFTPRSVDLQWGTTEVVLSSVEEALR